MSFYIRLAFVIMFRIETNICNVKFQESDLQIDQVLLGKAAVPFNPNSQLLPAASSSVVSIPYSNFKGCKGFSKTFILMLQVAVPYKVPNKGNKKNRRESSLENSVVNGKDTLIMV